MRFRGFLCVPLGMGSMFLAIALATVPVLRGNGPSRDAAAGRVETGTEPAGIARDADGTYPRADGGAHADSPPTGTAPAFARRADGGDDPIGSDQGDALALALPGEARDAFCVLYDGAGKRLSRAPGFLADPRIPGSPWVFALAVPATAQSGVARVETILRLADGSVRTVYRSVTIREKAFFTEDVRLNAANTAIRTDASPARLRQIDRLNEILFGFNPGAARFYGPWKAPVGAVRRSSGFSDRRVYRYSNGKKDTTYHYGIDFAVPRGTPVFAAGDGLVVLAESRISTGWTAVIEHWPGMYSLYYHMDALTCAEGEFVRAGTLIGRSGSTGLSTGPHLHWEVRLNGTAISPDWLLGWDLPTP